MKDLIILGVGGNCLDILDAVLALNDTTSTQAYRIRGFLDDAAEHGKAVQGFPVLGKLTEACRFPECFFVNGIGSFRNYWRKPEIIARTGIATERFETIIHPQGSVSRFASLGNGTVVLQHATINAQAKVGSHVIVLPNSVISHDVLVGDFTCIASGATIAGGVRIGKACYLGANCSINNGVSMGDFSLVGMGAAVLKDVAERAVVAGNPARLLRSVC